MEYIGIKQITTLINMWLLIYPHLVIFTGAVKGIKVCGDGTKEGPTLYEMAGEDLPE